MTEENGKIIKVAVQMGKAEVGEKLSLKVCGKGIDYIPVSMGNPHAVVFTGDAENAPLTTVGAAMERHREFPEGVNVEFVQIINPGKLRMRVWERGSGVTMACGTGACASAAAAVKSGYCSADTDIEVCLDGGILDIKISDDYTVTMTGPAEMIYEGETIE